MLEHAIQYNGEVIPYKIIKSKIKNIYIYVKDGIVTVKAPNRIKDKYIYDFIAKKSSWIYKTVKKDIENPKVEEVIEKEDIARLESIVRVSIEKYSKCINEIPNKVKIKNMKYAWGSCTSNRNISINAKLAKKPEQIIEYVVLHEMCHLKYMNHSREFWNLVERNMPDYKQCRKSLK